MIKNLTELLDKLERHDLHLHTIYKEQRAEVFANLGRFDDGCATHFLMCADKVLWIGQLSYFESWLNSNFRSRHAGEK